MITREAIKGMDPKRAIIDISSMPMADLLPNLLHIIEDMLALEHDLNTKSYLESLRAELQEDHKNQSMSTFMLAFKMARKTSDDLLKNKKQLASAIHEINFQLTHHAHWHELSVWLYGFYYQTYAEAEKDDVSGKPKKDAKGFFLPNRKDSIDLLFKASKGIVKHDLIIHYKKLAKAIERKLADGESLVLHSAIFKI